MTSFDMGLYIFSLRLKEQNDELGLEFSYLIPITSQDNLNSKEAMTKISNLSRDASNEDNRYVNHLAFKYIYRRSVVVAIKLPYFYLYGTDFYLQLIFQFLNVTVP